MDHQVLAAALGPVGPFLPPLVGLYLLVRVVRMWTPWGPRRNTDAVIWELLGGLVLMGIAVNQAVAVICAAGPRTLAQEFPAILTVCSILVLLDEIYRRIKGSIILARASG